MDNVKQGTRLLPLIIAAFLSALAALIFYLPTLGFEFVNWDDQACVYENPNIASFNGAFLRYAFTAVVNSNWHPLTVISYAVDYSIWGLNPLGYHLTNIVFHSAATFLVTLLATQLALRAKGGNVAVFAGLFTGLLFGLHPLHVESVAWIAERKDVLSGFFFVLSLLLYLRYTRLTSKAAFVLSIFAFILALLSKPMAITLPLVLLLLDFYPLNRLSNVKRCLLEKAPFFALSGVTGVLTVWAQRSVEAVAPLDAYPLSVRLFVTVKAYAFYIYKTLLPVGLAPFYPRRMDASLLSFEFIGSLVFLIAITVFAIVMMKKSKAYITAWLFYLITLFPVIGVVQVGSQAAADRYMYIPSISLFAVASFGLAYLIDRLSSRALTVSAAAAVVLCAVIGGLTLKQSAIWKDSVSLWSREVEVYPEDAPIGYNNLGLAYKASGDLEKAVYYYNKALSVDPFYSDAYNNRGVIFMRAGDYPKAIEDFSTAFRINPMNLEAISNRGAARVNSGDLVNAVEDITKAISLSPENAFFGRNYFNRGLAYKGLRENSKAIEDFSKTIEFEPMFVPAYLNRGVIYLGAGDFESAIRDLSYAAGINPTPGVYLNLGISYMKKGDGEKAALFLSKASSMGSAQAESLLKTLRP